MQSPQGTSTHSYDQEIGTRLLSATTPSSNFSYDADGNLTSKPTPSGSFSFSYDPLNQLKEVKLNGGNGMITSTFLWDEEHLVQQARGGTPCLYSWRRVRSLSP